MTNQKKMKMETEKRITGNCKKRLETGNWKRQTRKNENGIWGKE